MNQQLNISISVNKRENIYELVWIFSSNFNGLIEILEEYDGVLPLYLANKNKLSSVIQHYLISNSDIKKLTKISSFIIVLGEDSVHANFYLYNGKNKPIRANVELNEVDVIPSQLLINELQELELNSETRRKKNGKKLMYIWSKKNILQIDDIKQILSKLFKIDENDNNQKQNNQKKDTQ